MDNIANIRQYFSGLFLQEEVVRDKTGVPMIELIGVQFEADEFSIFGNLNERYIEQELDWYKKATLNINDMEGNIPAIWREVANEKGDINSNYGWCITSPENYSQFINVLMELQNNKESRRAIMIYTRPSMWQDYSADGKNDFICTNTVQYFIRHGKLHSYVSMRSNDAVFGFRNDCAWQKYVWKELLKSLKEKYPDLKLGRMFWNCGSLHIYQRHFYLLAWFTSFGSGIIAKSDFNKGRLYKRHLGIYERLMANKPEPNYDLEDCP